MKTLYTLVVTYFFFHCSVEERERVLESDRLAKLEEWKVSLSRLQEMLVEQEDAFKEHDGVAADLETVMLKKSEIEVAVIWLCYFL